MKKITVYCFNILFFCVITIQTHHVFAYQKTRNHISHNIQKKAQQNETEMNHFNGHIKMLRPTVHPFYAMSELHEKDKTIPERLRDFVSDLFSINSNGSSFGKNNVNSEPVAWVKNYASGLASCSHRATAIAIDDAGNSYVTGYSWSLATGIDFLTVKYNATGEQLWAVRYDCENRNDLACAIGVDPAGNVYITGWSSDSYYATDYVTIKYNSSGILQWSDRYNGPGDDDDSPTAIAVDKSGNVYVTGQSYGSDSSYDYTTIKYNTSGIEQWIARYDGTDNGWDEATALAIDDSGNVYVTGSSRSADTYYDYATVKYNSSGTEIWISRFNTPGDYSRDYATSLAVDDSGNVFVTGCGDYPDSYYDYATVKYNSHGIQQWAVNYNGIDNEDECANDIAVDEEGNVYVTGNSAQDLYYLTDCIMVTVKYDSKGNELWTASYNDPQSSQDKAISIAISGNEHILVIGSSYYFLTEEDYVTVKYNSSGSEQWVATYNGVGNDYDYSTALAVDGAGAVYVTGYSEGSGQFGHYATIKYSSSGVEQWVTRYDEIDNSYDYATALAVSVDGNIYVTGYSHRVNSNYDYATVKYNPSGEEQWIARFNGKANRGDKAIAIIADESGNVYVTGNSEGEKKSPDYATVKYNPSGVEQWCTYYNGPGDSSDYVSAIAIDNAGNIYVTGKSYAEGTASDFATVKYNSSGIEQWSARYNGSANGSDSATDITVDNSGNVYVTGTTYRSETYYDFVTVKYNTSGVEQWIAYYTGTGSYSYDYATGIASDDAGNVYVTGTSRDDYTTIKYNSEGVEQWVVPYNGPATSSSYDEANALALDDSGNVYVTGSSRGTGTYYDFATIKYNSSGAEQWVSRYNSPENEDDEALAIVVDDSGNVYVTGNSENSNYEDDFVTIRYNPSGILQWVNRYDNWIESVAAIALDEFNNVYVTGSSRVGSYMSAYTTIKYNHDQTLIPVELSTFSGGETNGRVTLYWRTESESNSYGFNVERSIDKTDYVTIGFVKSHGTSSTAKDYRFYDEDIVAGTYYYRLKQIDLDGTFEYSESITIRVAAPSNYELSQNYPNPFNPQTKISFSLPNQERVIIKIYNMNGQLESTLLNDLTEPGKHHIIWNAADKPNGVYLCQFQAGAYQKTLKLLLVK